MKPRLISSVVVAVYIGSVTDLLECCFGACSGDALPPSSQQEGSSGAGRLTLGPFSRVVCQYSRQIRSRGHEARLVELAFADVRIAAARSTSATSKCRASLMRSPVP